jgi:membrane-bound serine protease (ClpP class)
MGTADAPRRPFVLFSALLWLVSSAAFAQARPSVLVAKVDGSIDRTLASYLGGAVADAEDAGSTLVIQLDSAGTLDEDAVELAERIHDASVPVIVWVGPSPAKAQGAGLLFMYAGEPGRGGPRGRRGARSTRSTSRRRSRDLDPQVQDLATGWVTERGRETPLSLPRAPGPRRRRGRGQHRERCGRVHHRAARRVDGLTVGTADGRVTLHTKIATTSAEPRVQVKFVDLGPIDRVLHAAASPTWIYVLLVLGLAGLAFESRSPASASPASPARA